MRDTNRRTLRPLRWTVTAACAAGAVLAVGCSSSHQPLVTVVPRDGGESRVERLAGVDASWDAADTVSARVARFEPKPLVTRDTPALLGAMGDTRLGMARE